MNIAASATARGKLFQLLVITAYSQPRYNNNNTEEWGACTPDCNHCTSGPPRQRAQTSARAARAGRFEGALSSRQVN